MKKHIIYTLYSIYQSLARTYKRKILLSLDASLCFLSILCAFTLRESLAVLMVNIANYFWPILFLVVVKLITFKLKGMYSPILRYTGMEFISTVAKAVILSSGSLVFLGYLEGNWPLPRSILVIDALLTLVLIVSSRILIRRLFQELNNQVGNSKEKQRLMIYGAGDAGSQLARALIYESQYQIMGFIDDNCDLRCQIIQGFKVFGANDLPDLYSKSPFDLVVLAITHLSKTRRREIVKFLDQFPVTVKTVPSMAKLVSGDVSISRLRNIDVTELLGREEVLPYPELLHINITGKTVLVTGAGGSIGSELCRQIAQLSPKGLILYEMSEFALYSIEMELAETYPQLFCVAYLGNVTDEIHFQSVLRQHRVDTIYHAAAYKHVPIVEANPALGIHNNVRGSLVVARSAIACKVAHMVMISTDKAVRPTNIMGASKRIAELVVQALADLGEHRTCFTCVRFGNVLDSSGSVVPRFRKQLAEGHALTVTDLEVTRYFMSIPEAVRLVIQAGAMAAGGEVFVLDMGEPIRIYDLAVQMTKLSGLELGRDVSIEITGLRPGEKLYEELLIDKSKATATRHPRIFCAREYHWQWAELETQLEYLLMATQTYNLSSLMEIVKKLVPEYQPPAPTEKVIQSQGN